MIEKLLSTTKAALIINEMQLGNFKMFPALGAEVARRGIVPKIAELANAFRAKGLPVIHTPTMHHPNLADVKRNSMIASFVLKTRAMIKGTEDAWYVEGLEPQPDDHVSQRSSGIFAFQGTDLNVRLRRMGVDTIVLVGVSSTLGIPGLAFAGVDLAYHVIVPEDCIAGTDQVVHEILVQEQLRIVSTITNKDDVIAALG
jgi:nicotinamidase-related amidase